MLAQYIIRAPISQERMVYVINRYEDDYSQLPDEELCLRHASSR